jgi:hypothetical protein
MMKKLNTTMSAETHDALKEYCNRTEVPMARVIERAVKEYIKKRDEMRSEYLASVAKKGE